MAFDRAAAKEAGYSNEEIEAFIAANPHVETKQDKDQRQATKLPSPEEVMGRTGSNPSQEVDRTNEGLATTAMGVGAGAAAVGIPVLAYKAGKAILSPAAQGVKQFAQQGLDVGRSAVSAMENRTAVDALREQGCNVKGMVAIFTYGFEEATENMKKANCALTTLCDYDTLIEVALKQHLNLIENRRYYSAV